MSQIVRKARARYRRLSLERLVVAWSRALGRRGRCRGLSIPPERHWKSGSPQQQRNLTRWDSRSIAARRSHGACCSIVRLKFATKVLWKIFGKVLTIPCGHQTLDSASSVVQVAILKCAPCAFFIPPRLLGVLFLRNDLDKIHVRSHLTSRI